MVYMEWYVHGMMCLGMRLSNGDSNLMFPVMATSSDGNLQCDLFFRSKLIKSVFKMKDDPASMQGVTQERAYELVTNDKIDDLLEEVLKG